MAKTKSAIGKKFKKIRERKKWADLYKEAEEAAREDCMWNREDKIKEYADDLFASFWEAHIWRIKGMPNFPPYIG